jgi:hypothetical protein
MKIYFSQRRYITARFAAAGTLSAGAVRTAVEVSE